MSATLDAVIIGCGRIAGGYHMRNDSDIVITHAHAYCADGRYQLTACIDPVREQREALAARWGIETCYDSIDAWRTAGGSAQVASVCTPTESHADVLEALCKCGVRAVWCEKPLTGDPDRSARELERLTRAGVGLMVGYQRRWDARMHALRETLRAGKWGHVQSACGYYTRGLLNNGSHMINLLQFLLGPLVAMAAWPRPFVAPAGDLCVDALLDGPTGTRVHLIAGEHQSYEFFELRLVTEAGVVEIEDAGNTIIERRVVDDPVIAGYRIPGPRDSTATALGQAFPLMADELYSLATGADSPPSETTHSAIETERTIDQLRALASEVALPTGGRFLEAR